MSKQAKLLPIPFVTNVMIDARAADVEISVDPALIFDGFSAVSPGCQIKSDNQETGVSVNVQKGAAFSSVLLMTNDKAAELVESLVTCMVRSDPKALERVDALLLGIEKAMTAGLETPARLPGQQFGCVQVEGGLEVVIEESEEKEVMNAPTESD